MLMQENCYEGHQINYVPETGQRQDHMKLSYLNDYARSSVWSAFGVNWLHA